MGGGSLEPLFAAERQAVQQRGDAEELRSRVAAVPKNVPELTALARPRMTVRGTDRRPPGTRSCSRSSTQLGPPSHAAGCGPALAVVNGGPVGHEAPTGR
ncbi:hypothetical protein GCM10014715_87290 [Streptomyces spiralis]|uniref:Uncharacterized protein n=1 Tax=Streptomyces spiralis TaxID=66376 RepID=A0A919E6U5_9ACTN|nr:hypothetical protein GCM10014715_87290 [Streptomyces spiralis]